MINVPIDRIVPLTDARDNFSRIVADIENQKDGMYVLTKGGKPAIALININYLAEIMKGSQSAPEMFSKPAEKPAPNEPKKDVVNVLPKPAPKVDLPSFDVAGDLSKPKMADQDLGAKKIEEPKEAPAPKKEINIPTITTLPGEKPVASAGSSWNDAPKPAMPKPFEPAPVKPKTTDEPVIKPNLPAIDPSWTTPEPAKPAMPAPSTPDSTKPKMPNPWPISNSSEQSSDTKTSMAPAPMSPTPPVMPILPKAPLSPAMPASMPEPKPTVSTLDDIKSDSTPEPVHSTDSSVESKPIVPVLPPLPPMPPVSPVPSIPVATIPSAPSLPTAPAPTSVSIPTPPAAPIVEEKKADLPPPPANPITIPFDEPPKTDSEPGEPSKPATPIVPAAANTTPPPPPANPNATSVQDLEV